MARADLPPAINGLEKAHHRRELARRVRKAFNITRHDTGVRLATLMPRAGGPWIGMPLAVRRCSASDLAACGAAEWALRCEMLQGSSSLVAEVREEGLLELLRGRSVIRGLLLQRSMCSDPHSMRGSLQDERSTPSTWRRNSGSSSRKSMPWCASDTSPGLGRCPPPISPTAELV
jgi:hypothetical protein